MSDLTDGLFFVELSAALTDGRSFDALIAGTFTDMYGREVEFTQSDLEAYVANTQAAIDAATTDSGEVVGLPIDSKGHDKGDGAGWIVGIELAGDKIRVKPRWTEIGRDLISKGIRRFFSATVNTAEKVILGGTLTNWPATRAKDGRIMLRPVELESPIYAVQTAGEGDGMEANHVDKAGADPDINLEAVTAEEVNIMTELTQNELAQTVSDLVKQALAENISEYAQAAAAQPEPGEDVDIIQLLGLQDVQDATADQFREAMLEQYDAMRTRATQEAARMIAGIRRESNVAEFVQRATGGSEDVPYGLPVEADKLQAWLMSLNQKQAEFAQALLDDIRKSGRIEFAELGHGKRRNGTRELSDPMRQQLKKWTDAGMTAEAFFIENADVLGEMEQYDPAQFALA